MHVCLYTYKIFEQLFDIFIIVLLISCLCQGRLPVQPAFVTLRRQQLEPHVTQYVFSHMTEGMQIID